MQYTEAFGSFLKADDLAGHPRRVTIEEVTLEEMPDGKSKLVCKFQGVAKALVLNKTNADLLFVLTGEADTDNWRGQEVELYTEKVQFSGKLVDGIRIRRGEGEDTSPPF